MARRLALRAALTFTTAAVALAAGCAGEDSSLFGPPATGAGTGSGTATGTAVAGSGGAGGTATATPGGSGGTGATGGTAGSGAQPTGGQGGGVAGAGGQGGSPHPGEGEVECVSEVCELSADEYCCMSTLGAASGECLQSGQTCWGTSFPVWCDGPEDCLPTEFCCGTNYTGMGYSLIQCEAECGGYGKIIICDPDEPASCPTGTCEPSSILPPGYFVCRD